MSAIRKDGCAAPSAASSSSVPSPNNSQLHELLAEIDPQALELDDFDRKMEQQRKDKAKQHQHTQHRIPPAKPASSTRFDSSSTAKPPFSTSSASSSNTITPSNANANPWQARPRPANTFTSNVQSETSSSSSTAAAAALLNIWKPARPAAQSQSKPPVQQMNRSGAYAPPSFGQPITSSSTSVRAPSSTGPQTSSSTGSTLSASAATQLLKASATRRTNTIVNAVLSSTAISSTDDKPFRTSQPRTSASTSEVLGAAKTSLHPHSTSSATSAAPTAHQHAAPPISNLSTAFAAGRSFPAFHSSQRTQRSKHFSSSQQSPSATPSQLTQASKPQPPDAASAIATTDTRATNVATTASGAVPAASEEEDDGIEKCAICTYPLNDLAVLPCLHYYCLSCISEWFQISTTCPLCKAPADKLQHFNPPLVPQKMNQLSNLFLDSTVTAPTNSSTNDDLDSNNPLVLFVSRAKSQFHASHPGVALETLSLPIEQIEAKPRLGLDGHEQEDFELANRMYAAQQEAYDNFALEAQNSDEEEMDVVCVFCNEPSDPDVLLLCDDCNLGYHTYCLDPPLRAVPPGDWFCPHCIETVEKEIREERAAARADPSACIFHGGPSSAYLQTPPRSQANRRQYGSGSSRFGSAESQERSEKKRRIRIFVRRTLEREEKSQRANAENVWAPANSSTSSSHLNPARPQVSWGRIDPFQSLQRAKQQLLNANARASFQRDSELDYDDDEEIEYDSRGYPLPSRKERRAQAKKKRSRGMRDSASEEDEYEPGLRRSANDEDEIQYNHTSEEEQAELDGRAHKAKRNKQSATKPASKKAKSSRKSVEDLDEFDFAHEELLRPVVGAKPAKQSKTTRAEVIIISPDSKHRSPEAKLKKRRKRRRRLDDEDDDEEDGFLAGFIDDEIRPATPSSDEDGTKAAFLPTQRDNTRSRRQKLAKNRAEKSSIQATWNHREKIMGRRGLDASSNNRREQIDEEGGEQEQMEQDEGMADEQDVDEQPYEIPNDDEDDDEDEEEYLPIRKKKRVVRTFSSSSSEFVLSASKAAAKRMAQNSQNSARAQQKQKKYEAELVDDDLEDISSFDNTQDKRPKGRALLASLSSLDRLSSPLTTAAASTSTQTSSTLPSNNSFAIPKRSSNITTTKPYQLPLVTSTSKRNNASLTKKSSRGEQVHEESKEGSTYNRSRDPPVSGGSDDDFDLPVTSNATSSNVHLVTSGKTFVKQSLGSKQSKFFAQGNHNHTPRTPAAASTISVNRSTVVPETPYGDMVDDDDADHDLIPTSSPNSPIIHPLPDDANSRKTSFLQGRK